MRNKYNIAEHLISAQVAISNAIEDEQIRTEMEKYGYNEAKMNVGKKLYEETEELQKKQKMEYGEQYEATKAVEEAWDKANKVYMKAIKVARVAMKNNYKAQEGLGLGGRRKKSVTGWINQSKLFYDNLLQRPDLLAEMDEFRFNAEKLNKDRTLVEVVEQEYKKQRIETGEAQDATKARDAKLDELDEWISDFKAIAHVALEEHPQRLEKLGIFVRS
jgi:hypothetical protein